MSRVTGKVEEVVTAEFICTLGGDDGKTEICAWFPKVRINGKEYLCNNKNFPRGLVEAPTEEEAIALGITFRDIMREHERLANEVQ